MFVASGGRQAGADDGVDGVAVLLGEVVVQDEAKVHKAGIGAAAEKSARQAVVICPWAHGATGEG